MNTKFKMDSEIIENTQVLKIPSTQEGVKSKVRYSWVVLFHFDINNENPFIIVKLRDFLDCEFPWRSIKQEFSREFRIKLFEFSCFPGKQFFIFAKIQYGNYTRPTLYMYSINNNKGYFCNTVFITDGL